MWKAVICFKVKDGKVNVYMKNSARDVQLCVFEVSHTHCLSYTCTANVKNTYTRWLELGFQVFTMPKTGGVRIIYFRLFMYACVLYSYACMDNPNLPLVSLYNVQMIFKYIYQRKSIDRLNTFSQDPGLGDILRIHHKY